MRASWTIGLGASALGLVLAAGCDKSPVTATPVAASGPAVNPATQPAAERVGRSASRLEDAVASWRVAWDRAGSPKAEPVVKLFLARAGRARGWAGFPPENAATLQIAASDHREVATKTFGAKDIALIADLDRDARTNPANNGRNGLMSSALESSQRLSAALEDIAAALDALADTYPAPK